jgi:hypothetical protein
MRARAPETRGPIRVDFIQRMEFWKSCSGTTAEFASHRGREGDHFFFLRIRGEQEPLQPPVRGRPIFGQADWMRLKRIAAAPKAHDTPRQGRQPPALASVTCTRIFGPHPRGGEGGPFCHGKNSGGQKPLQLALM